MTLEQKRDYLIFELETNYNMLSESEILDICLEIENIDNYLDECRMMNSL